MCFRLYFRKRLQVVNSQNSRVPEVDFDTYVCDKI